ncbi:MAG TPA: glycosyltransferase family 39 protein [Lentimicrobium sp.]|nr:glycosyltransferase family 39 protein [Lentimicrobium sp.]
MIPTLLLNLGLFPLISDEPTRGIVTLEMLISGDYFHPTINGEAYLNKPPLFNWLQSLFIVVTGSMKEYAFRLPTVLSLISIASIIYFTSRKFLSDYAFIAATGYIICGRILFWDSFMGLIDISYSLITFCSFVWLIYYYQSQRYLILFIGSYLLSAIGFLMKGMPSLAFQLLSVSAILIYNKQYKQLFSIKHLAGIIIFFTIIGTYLYVYSLNRPAKDLIFQFLKESNRLQAGNTGHLNWWLHLIAFPFNYFYEFLPLTILLILLFSKYIRQQTFSNYYFRHLVILFLVNIVVYWISADMRSRYLFMLVPLLTIVLVKAYSVGENVNHRLYLLTRNIFSSGSLLVTFSILIYPIWIETRHFDNVVLICSTFFIISFSIWMLSLRLKKLVLYSLVCSMLLARIAFNFFNFEARLNSYPDKGYRDGEIKAAQISHGYPLYILSDSPINHDASFYITRERREILRRTILVSHPGAFYISNEENLNIFARNSKHYRVHHIFRIKKDETRLYLVTAR